jgi:dihydroorotate dehydrogenase (NAD+) catalytic subunit
MIYFSNGHVLTFACGSGALNFNGRGWWWEKPLIWTKIIDPKSLTVVAKTVTLYPRKGNLVWWKPWSCVRLAKGGAVNAIGLTNPGIDWWIKNSYQEAMSFGYKMAASIQPENKMEAIIMGERLTSLNLAYVEINISCPNVNGHEDLDKAMAMLDALNFSCCHPVVVKISYDQAFNYEFLEMLEEHPKVEAIHAINSVPWDHLYKPLPSPLEKSTGRKGGVSGPPIKRYTARAVKYVAQCTKVPIIAGGGIWDMLDVMHLEKMGASAFSLGTLFLRKPWCPKRIVQQYMDHKEYFNGPYSSNSHRR